MILDADFSYLTAVQCLAVLITDPFLQGSSDLEAIQLHSSGIALMTMSFTTYEENSNTDSEFVQISFHGTTCLVPLPLISCVYWIQM